MKPRQVADLRRILRDRRPLIDLRAPAEFALGAFPGAVNLPLLTDAERTKVGTRYKECGQQAAISLGEELVSGETRQARIEAWRGFCQIHRDATLYCWRGGLRSQIAQRWLHEEGVDVARVEGGYKALRRACLQVIEEFCTTTQLLVIGGRTGSGKTDLLNEFEVNIDLERLANHRGSAFGSTFTGQPTPIGFENGLAIELLRRMEFARVLIEDESRTIGRLAVPDSLHAVMQTAPLYVVEVSRDERARRICEEYVEVPLSNGIVAERLHGRFLDSVDRIQRRLGGVRHAEVRRTIDAAFALGTFQPGMHLKWIERLLDWYYDPMYDHQLTAKRSRIVRSGDRATIRAALQEALRVGSGDPDTAAMRD